MKSFVVARVGEIAEGSAAMALKSASSTRRRAGHLVGEAVRVRSVRVAAPKSALADLGTDIIADASFGRGIASSLLPKPVLAGPHTIKRVKPVVSRA